MPWHKHIGPITLALVIGAGLSYGFWPRPLLVEAAPVARQPLRVTVEEEGKTRVIDRYQISAPIAGYARRIELDVGDTIGQGQVLAWIEPLPSEVLDPRRQAQATARVAAAEASLRAAEQTAAATQAAADYAQTEFRRLAALCQRQCVISQDERDRAESRARQAEANLRSSRFTVEVTRHDLEAARTALRYSASREIDDAREGLAIRSPITGRVLAIPRKSEGVVEAGRVLLEIGDARALEVEVDLLSAEAVRVRPGTPVRFEHWGGEQSLEGVTRVVEPVGFTKVSALGVEEQRVLAIVDLISPPEAWSRLGDGYRVEASFILWEGQAVLQIPASALFRRDDGWVAFVVEGGKARQRAVEPGQRGGLNVGVRSGLREGETVIIHPDDALADGAAVRVR